MKTALAPQLSLSFDDGFDQEAKRHAVTDPASYKGLYALHKYWGKKPHEVLGYVVDHLTQADDVVLDPFMGSGTTGRESLLRGRRFIGCDLNPCAVELAELMVSPPEHDLIATAFEDIRKRCRDRIYATYSDAHTTAPSHFLWRGPVLEQVWVTGENSRRVVRRPATLKDQELSLRLDSYETFRLRPLRFFKNSRINASPELGWRDLFAGRALRNLDLLHEAICSQPAVARRTLLLALTASSGQMSKMVFAISGRGKTTGKTSDRIEVGSWVIGYWRPILHFEVNAWDCFERRTTKFLKALAADDPLRHCATSNSVNAVIEGNADASIQVADSRRLIASIPDNSISLIITDPPHSDRIPYLELSEMWNAILGESPEFTEELVVSNARVRRKSKSTFAIELRDTLQDMSRVLRPDGFLVLVFNARNVKDWEGITTHMNRDNQNNALIYAGRFPVHYSTGSVVQDNRGGGLKYDYAMVFTRATSGPFAPSRQLETLRKLEGWEPAGKTIQT